VSQICAEPSPTVRKLMDEPVSLFEYGLYKLEKMLQNIDFSDEHYHYNNPENRLLSQPQSTYSEVYYEWNRNRIVIRLHATPENPEKLSALSAKDICKRLTERVRGLFQTHLKNNDFYGVYRYFAHQSFTNITEQEKINRIKEIENMVYIKVDVSNKIISPGLIKYDIMISCESPLMEKDIYYTDVK